MTVRELRTWLLTQDQDASVLVIAHESGRGYYDQGGTAAVVAFHPGLSEQYAAGAHRCLLLGEIGGRPR